MQRPWSTLPEPPCKDLIFQHSAQGWHWVGNQFENEYLEVQDFLHLWNLSIPVFQVANITECTFEGLLDIAVPQLKDLESVYWTLLWLPDLFWPVLWLRTLPSRILHLSQETRQKHVKSLQSYNVYKIHIKSELVFTWWLCHTWNDFTTTQIPWYTQRGQRYVCHHHWVSQHLEWCLASDGWSVHPIVVDWLAEGREGYSSFKVRFGEFDFRTIDCQEGEMNLTRGRVNLSGKGSGGLNTEPQKVIK